MLMRVILTDGTGELIKFLPRDLHHNRYVVFVLIVDKNDVRKVISQSTCVLFYGSFISWAFIKNSFPELESKPYCSDLDLTIGNGDVVIVYRPQLGYIMLEYRSQQ
jgi:hypothetical protein